MIQLLTPGVYRQPLEPVRPAARLARGDIPVFIGYTQRGPVGLPVRVETLQHVEAIFGKPQSGGYLWHALKGFFETGGLTAYILRLVSDSARAATTTALNQTQIDTLPLGKHVRWQAQASFPWLSIDPRRLKSPSRAEAANWTAIVERIVREVGERTPDPGDWANQLTLTVARSDRARITTIPLDQNVESTTASVVPAQLRLLSLAGVKPWSVVELSQTRDDTNNTRTVTGIAIVSKVDAARQTIELDRALSQLRPSKDTLALASGAELTSDGLLSLDETKPIRVSSVEFSFEVFLSGKRSQQIASLSLHPLHSNSLTTTLSSDARDLMLTPVVYQTNPNLVPAPGIDTFTPLPPPIQNVALQEIDWSDEIHWPDEGLYQLSGGVDGLADVNSNHYLRYLSLVSELNEVAMVAAPDLVTQAGALPPSETAPQPEIDCCDLSPAELGQVKGLVLEIDNEGNENPLRMVDIRIPGTTGSARTDSNGKFFISNIPNQLLTLRLTSTGYEPLEYLLQATRFTSTEEARIFMDPVSNPPVLSQDSILQIQNEMSNPSRVGLWKIAILDSPNPNLQIAELQTWRSRLTDSDRAGFFGPWLRVPFSGGDDGRLIECPPCGHVCGAFAAAELVHGIHRSGANQPIRYAEGVTLDISDQDQAVLNPVGINAIRTFPGRGIRLFGTRSVSSDPTWLMLTTRRIIDALEKTLERGLHWMVFEPNNLMSRHAVATTAETLLERLWRDGALAGDTPAAAFQVKCDLDNNPNETRQAGQLVVDISVAPTVPYEFVLFRLGQTYDAIKITEAER